MQHADRNDEDDAASLQAIKDGRIEAEEDCPGTPEPALAATASGTADAASCAAGHVSPARLDLAAVQRNLPHCPNLP
jgi:hypothetical protein